MYGTLIKVEHIVRKIIKCRTDPQLVVFTGLVTLPNGKVYGIEGSNLLPLHEINPLTGATSRLDIATPGGTPTFVGLARWPYWTSSARFLAMGGNWCLYQVDLDTMGVGQLVCWPTFAISFSALLT